MRFQSSLTVCEGVVGPWWSLHTSGNVCSPLNLISTGHNSPGSWPPPAIVATRGLIEIAPDQIERLHKLILSIAFFPRVSNTGSRGPVAPRRVLGARGQAESRTTTPARGGPTGGPSQGAGGASWALQGQCELVSIKIEPSKISTCKTCAKPDLTVCGGLAGSSETD